MAPDLLYHTAIANQTDHSRRPTMSSSASFITRVRRLSRQLSYAQRRLFELQTGIPTSPQR